MAGIEEPTTHQNAVHGVTAERAGFRSAFSQAICDSGWSRVASFGAVLLFSAALAAQDSFTWLSESVTPRGLALANSFVAGADHPDAMSLNPAGLQADSGSWTFELGFGRYPAGITPLFLRGIHQRKAAVVGYELSGLAYGTFQGYNIQGEPEGTYRANDVMLRRATSRRVGEHLSAGYSLAVAANILPNWNAMAIVWTAGLQYELPAINAVLGAVMQNNGRVIRLSQDDSDGRSPDLEDKLPATWRIGLAKALAYLPLTLYFSVGENLVAQRPIMALGGEFHLPGGFSLRFGVDESKNDYRRGKASPDLLAGLSLGVGARIRRRSYFAPPDSRKLATMRLDAGVKLLGPLGVNTVAALSVVY